MKNWRKEEALDRKIGKKRIYEANADPKCMWENIIIIIIITTDS